MNDTPRKPVGSSAKINFDRRLHDEVFQKRRFISTPEVRFDKTTRGIRARLNLPPRGAGELLSKYFPFRIYVFPSGKRTTPDPDTDWRKFRVRNGRIYGNTITPVEPAGTDGATNPDDRTVDEADMTDITVASGVAKHWFWLDIDETSATAVVQNSATPPAGWTLTIIPIGYVDTLTYEADQRADIIQALRTDVIIPCLNFPAE